MSLSVEFIAVGTELLLGQIVNTNASWVGSRLADAGPTIFYTDPMITPHSPTQFHPVSSWPDGRILPSRE